MGTKQVGERFDHEIEYISLIWNSAAMKKIIFLELTTSASSNRRQAMRA
jgi:hypothetical protein